MTKENSMRMPSGARLDRTAKAHVAADAFRTARQQRHFPPASGTVAAALVERAPGRLQPYLRLMRIQAPIGTWLYALPGWWGLSLATHGWPGIRGMVVFGIAAAIMRGSICTTNDIVDRHIDALVIRTASRPLPSGAVSVGAAVGFSVAEALLAITLLWWVSGAAALIVAVSYPAFIAYPYMKRITFFPQAWLGMCFNTMVLAGWVTVAHHLAAPALALWVAGFFWTFGYDTIYGHQDRVDDRRVGVKSTALLFAESSWIWVGASYSLAVVGLVVAGYLARVDWPYYAFILAVAIHFVWQVATLNVDDPQRCRMIFTSNRIAGLFVLAACVFGHW